MMAAAASASANLSNKGGPPPPGASRGPVPPQMGHFPPMRPMKGAADYFLQRQPNFPLDAGGGSGGGGGGGGGVDVVRSDSNPNPMFIPNNSNELDDHNGSELGGFCQKRNIISPVPVGGVKMPCNGTNFFAGRTDRRLGSLTCRVVPVNHRKEGKIGPITYSVGVCERVGVVWHPWSAKPRGYLHACVAAVAYCARLLCAEKGVER